MDAFAYRERALYCEEVALADVAARAGTPCYVYSAGKVFENFRAYDQAFGDLPHTVCYSVKANGNLAVLKLLAEAGVGKTAQEIDEALAAGIFVFNCESEPELALVDALAHRRGVKARVALRVNPDIDALTHAYIS